MRTALMAAAGWILPGGAHLMQRRYGRAAILAVVVCGMFAAGVAINGVASWPTQQDLEGLDGASKLLARAGWAAKAMAGGPFLVLRASGEPGDFASGFVHEYGTKLLVMAGLLNLLALVDALGQKEERA